jgi:hypothetical protein
MKKPIVLSIAGLSGLCPMHRRIADSFRAADFTVVAWQMNFSPEQ